MNNSDRIEKLKRLIVDKLSPLIDDDYVLLDVPNHCNIGDNLIWEGELQFLKEEVPHTCLYSANLFNWEVDKIQTAPIILFHGGGNFGDLYRICQDFRIKLIKEYKNKRIIIFPQTVWYNDINLLKQDCELIKDHPDLHICCRDQLSYDTLVHLVSEDKLILLPDMAFFCRINEVKIKTGKSLFLFRTDFEIEKSIKPNDTNQYDVKDWPTYPNNHVIWMLRAKWNGFAITLSMYLQKTLFSFLVDPVYGLNKRNNRERYIQLGIDFLSKYDEIYTTRLHGLILGILMGKKVVIIDNKYSKCTNFYKTWLKDFDLISIKHI